jgi:hypothetical protein
MKQLISLPNTEGKEEVNARHPLVNAGTASINAVEDSHMKGNLFSL